MAVLNVDDHDEPCVDGLRAGPVDADTRSSKRYLGDGTWFEYGIVMARQGRWDRPVVGALRGPPARRAQPRQCGDGVRDRRTRPGVRVGGDDGGASAFRGVPHRLELVGRAAGALWVNDSIATSPERTIAGLESSRSPWCSSSAGARRTSRSIGCRSSCAQRCRAVVCFGEAARPVRAAHAAASVVEVREVDSAGGGRGRGSGARRTRRRGPARPRRHQLRRAIRRSRAAARLPRGCPRPPGLRGGG